jgi:hypothetical protein
MFGWTSKQKKQEKLLDQLAEALFSAKHDKVLAILKTPVDVTDMAKHYFFQWHTDDLLNFMCRSDYNAEALEAALGCGAPQNLQRNLCSAIQGNNIMAIQWLLKKGANLNTPDPDEPDKKPIAYLKSSKAVDCPENKAGKIYPDGVREIETLFFLLDNGLDLKDPQNVKAIAYLPEEIFKKLLTSEALHSNPAAILAIYENSELPDARMKRFEEFLSNNPRQLLSERLEYLKQHPRKPYNPEATRRMWKALNDDLKKGGSAAFIQALKDGADPHYYSDEKTANMLGLMLSYHHHQWGDTDATRDDLSGDPLWRDEIQQLINAGAYVGEFKLKREEIAPLEYAMTGQGDLPLMKALLKAGANPDERFVDGSTPLAKAITYNEPAAAINTLLDYQANIDIRSANNRAPLELAVFSDATKPGIVKLLLDRGADPNMDDFNNHNSILARATTANAVFELITHKANMDLRGNDGKLPVQLWPDALFDELLTINNQRDHMPELEKINAYRPHFAQHIQRFWTAHLDRAPNVRDEAAAASNTSFGDLLNNTRRRPGTKDRQAER